MFRTTHFETLTKGEKIGEDGFLPQPSAQHPSPLTFLYSNLGSILPASIIGLIREYYVAPKEVTAFLKLVAEGEQDKAEAMLQSNFALALVPSDVTDLSKRTFINITGFQYAVWALDWHMWTMIRKYLPDEAAKMQAEAFETGSWVKSHGVHAHKLLDNLMRAYQITIDLYEQKKHTEGNTAWVKQVGGAQSLLPVHVVNEYCHPTRPFNPVPNFKDTLVLPRNRTIDKGQWFSASANGGKLGDKFAVYRGDAVCGGAVNYLEYMGVWRQFGFCFDQKSLRSLTSARMLQREELITELKSRNAQCKVTVTR